MSEVVRFFSKIVMEKNDSKQTFSFHSFLSFRTVDKGTWTNNDDTKNDNRAIIYIMITACQTVP